MDQSITPANIVAVMGGKVTGRDSCVVPGPGHSGADRSLSITVDAKAPDGFMVHSFADDDDIACKDYVREKLGLHEWKPQSDGFDLNRAKPQTDKPRTCDEYIYRQADDTPYLKVNRTTAKGFWQQHWDGRTWVKDAPKGPKIPYRLAQLLSAEHDDVFVVEGEKDANNLSMHGFNVTTNAGGAGNWTSDLNPFFKDKNVYILPDNDPAGTKHARKVATELLPFAREIRIINLPGLPDKGDVSDWLAAGGTAEQLVELARQAKLVKGEEDIAAEQSTQDDAAPLPFVDMSGWDKENVPPREWAVRDIIPRRNVFLFSGEGAAGKTLLILQLAIAHALGRDWIGMLPETGPVIFFGAEDDVDELHRRLHDVLNFYGATFADIEGKIFLLSYAGEDAVLGHTDKRTGLVMPTTLYHRLSDAAKNIEPVMICLDTSADVFAGDEVSRFEVRQFVGLLRKLAITANGAVIVNSHPSLTGISSGTGLSGSTGWHNSVRGRAYLTTLKTDKDEEPDPTLRQLEFKKNNYGPVAKSISLRWDQGVFKLVGGIATLDRMAAEQTAARLFIALLDRFNDQGRNVSEKAASKNYAPTMFVKEDDAKKFGVKKADFEAAMRRLFASSEISVQPYGAPSRGTTRLVTR